MSRLFAFLALLSFLSVVSCDSDPLGGDSDPSLSNSADGFSSSSSESSSSSSSSGSGTGTGTGTETESGLITAAEWNDLEDWDFWLELTADERYHELHDDWSFYTDHRISLKLLNGILPVENAVVELNKDGQTYWKSRSDNSGRAEVWLHAFDDGPEMDLTGYRLKVNGTNIPQSLKYVDEGINIIQIENSDTPENKIELAFIVDATGSMHDEISFLQDDLENVILRAQQENSSSEIRTASIFYRDEGDEYLFRKSEFSVDITTTLDFVADQSADGGGNYPEAVHTGLFEGIEQLDWSNDAKTRIAFLLLDAPPHLDAQVIDQLQSSIRIAAEQGVKIIPITASGINKDTEFLMRCFSILTNSTYVFITNDSGIGNPHLEASVGEHEIEFLNDLMVRLIAEYAE